MEREQFPTHPASRAFSHGTYALYRLLSAHKRVSKRGSARRVFPTNSPPALTRTEPQIIHSCAIYFVSPVDKGNNHQYYQSIARGEIEYLRLKQLQYFVTCGVDRTKLFGLAEKTKPEDNLANHKFLPPRPASCVPPPFPSTCLCFGIIKKLRRTGQSPSNLSSNLSADFQFFLFLSCSNQPCVYKSNFTCFAALKMSKKRQDNWQLCELCGRLFYCRHLNDHKAICEGNSTTECLQHSYIQDGVLHAVTVERNSKMLSGQARNIDISHDLVSVEPFTCRSQHILWDKIIEKLWKHYKEISRVVNMVCGPLFETFFQTKSSDFSTLFYSWVQNRYPSPGKVIAQNLAMLWM